MKKISKKLISFVLMLIMLVGLLPAGTISFATVGDTEGYNLVAASGSPHVSFLEYGEPHANWKFFDLCDDLWSIYETGKTPSYATDVDANGSQAKRVQGSMLYATKNARLRFLVGDYGKAIVNNGWFALRLKAPAERGIYKMSFTVPADDVYAGKSTSVWVAPYEKGKDDGAYYMTDENLIISGKSFGVAGSVITAEGVKNPGISEYVVVFRLDGRGSSSNWELHLKDISLVKTGELESEFTYAIAEAETEIDSPKNYGIYELSLTAKSGEDLSGVSAYIAPKGSTDLTTEENEVFGEGNCEKYFAALKGEDKLSLYIDGYEKVESATLRLVEDPQVSLSLSPEKLTEGKTSKTSVTVNGKGVTPWAVSVKSSDDSLVTVGADGVLNVLKPGEVTIEAMVGDVYNTENIASITKTIGAKPIEVTGAPAGYTATVIPEFGAYGIYSADISKKEDGSDEDFSIYFAEYRGGTAEGYLTEKNLIAKNVTYVNGKVSLAEAFTVKNDVPHILIISESVESFDYKKVRDLIYNYDLAAAGGIPHRDFLEYGEPHDNWKFFDLCDDLWSIYETGLTPSYATDVDANGSQAKRVQGSMLYATKNARLRFLVGDYGKAIVNNGWFAIRVKAPAERGTYKMSFTVPSNDVYAGKNVSVWVAPYEKGKDDGAYYMTDENLIISGKSFGVAGSVIAAEGIENPGISDYVVVFRLDGRGSSSNWELHLKDISLVKTGEIQSEFTHAITEAETEIDSPKNYGIYELSLTAKSGEDLSGVSAYIAPKGSTDLTTEENKVFGEGNCEKYFAALKGEDKLSLHIDGYEKVESATLRLVEDPQVSLSLSPEKLTEGKTSKTSVTVNGKGVTPWAVSVKSSDDSLVTVGADGVLNVLKPGEVTIEAMVGDVYNTENIASITRKISTPDAAALPEKITASFGSDVLETGEVFSLRVVDENGKEITAGNIDVTFDIGDEEIISFDGINFRTDKLGKTLIKVRATMGEDFRECEVPVSVVGKNLLTRVAANGIGAPVAHGSFENGIVAKLGEEKAPPADGASFWFPSNNYLYKDRSYFFNYFVVEGESPKYPGKTTNYLKFDFDWTKKAGVENSHMVRFQTAWQRAFDVKSNTGHIGFIQADKNKIYQFSGYFKTDETSPIKSTVYAYLRYANDIKNGALNATPDGTWTTPNVYIHNPATESMSDKVTPGEWKYFETAPVYANWEELQKTLSGGDEGVMWLDPYVDVITTESSNVVYYISEFAINEVSFTEVQFTNKGKFETAKTYDTFQTAIKPLTSLGREITLGDTTKKFDVLYSTSNSRVAKINQSGVITAVSNGECEVYADVTIGDTTVRGVLPVSFSGLEIIFESIEGTLADNNIPTGDTTAVTYKLYNTDGSEYVDSPDTAEDDVRIFYESENPLVAEIDQNGAITAVAAGETNIFVFAERGKILAKSSVPLTVYDDSEIASVTISGPNTVEKGFEVELSASGQNESGSRTLISDVKFEVADEKSKEFIEVSRDGTVRGIKEGTARVIATIKSVSGREKTGEPFEVEVVAAKPVNKVIDFRTGIQANGATKATFEKHGYTVNQELTSIKLVNDANSAKPDAFRWLPEGLFARLEASGTNTRDSDIAFNIKVDYDGWYLPSFTGTYHYYGPSRVDMYFNGEYIGNYNFYSPTIVNPGALKELNPVYLRKGTDNVLIFRLAEGAKWTYLQSLKLQYLEEIPTVSEVSVSVEKTTLAVGETSGIDTRAKLSNGSEYEFGFLLGYEGNATNPTNAENPDAYTRYDSSDTNVAEVRNGKLVAIAPGTCKITSTAFFNGAEGVKSKEIEITVTEETFGRIEVSPKVCETTAGTSTPITVKAYLTDGTEISKNDFTVECVSDSAAAVIDRNPFRIYANGGGKATVTVTVTFNGEEKTFDIPVDVISSGFATVNLSAYSQIMRPQTAGYDISVECLDASGGVLPSDNAIVTFESSDESVVSIDAEGHMTPGKLGVAEITATVDLDGVVRKGKMNVSVRMGKVERTYYTADKISAAQQNAREYDWARNTVRTAVKDADKYLEYAEMLYEMMPSEGIPRSFASGLVSDPDAYKCRYCGTNLKAAYADYPWVIDALKTPWKVKCPHCARLFPSNDFGAFYELGKNEKGEFNLKYALERHREKFIDQIVEEYGDIKYPGEEYTDSWYKYYGYGIEGGYLTNNLYPEIIDTDPATGDAVNGKWWGVDNGWGYRPGRTYDNGVEEVHTYIPMFVHNGLWSTNGAGSRFQPAIYRAITSFANAYIYTNDKKYARAGAMLLDRIADFYPDFDLNPYHQKYQNSNQHGKQGGGRILGNIWEAAILGPIYGVSYDAFFDIYEDPELLDFLTEKAIKYNQTDKLVDGRVTPEKLRSNVEKNLLEEMLPAVKAGDITGNFGFFQNVLIKTAIVLDDSTLTPEIIQFVMQAGEESGYYGSPCTGGNVFAQIMNIVDRDGFGDESSIQYNSIWADRLISVAEDLLDYSEIRPDYVKPEYNLFKNPKYIKMLQLYHPTAVSGATFANIGDNSDTGRRTPTMMAQGSVSLAKAGYVATGMPIFAQLLYVANGRSVDGIYTNIFDKDPEAIQKKIEDDIEKYGEIDYESSQLLSGYGYASLISGDLYGYDTKNSAANTIRTFWMYFGGGQGHRHSDRMNLGIDAYGYDFAPEFGYPEETGAAGSGVNTRWIAGTLSHNTVTVNEKRQDTMLRTGEADIRHFDDAGDIQLMDVNAPLSYKEITDIYRRTVLSVDIDEEASYAVDFFRVKGGNEHVYSFHSQSRQITFSDNLKLVKQPFGTYAGANIAYADNTAYTPMSGYNYLYNVRRAKNPGTGTFEADFKVEYLRIGQQSPQDLGLKFTMLNDWNIAEVASAFGKPPQKGNNPKEFEYLLVKREGNNLDTLFTSVIEPYKGASKVESIVRVEAKRADGKAVTENEPCAALKVTLRGGRVDYIVYAANNQREYIISDGGNEVFRFKGFVGVYTLRSTGETARVYLHDGVKLDDNTKYAIKESETTGAIKGKVRSFTEDNAFENFINVATSADVDPKFLVGKIINVETDDTQNGVYRIVGAEKIDGGYRISTGNVTLIRALRDPYDLSKGYICNIDKGANFEIPLSGYVTTAPTISTADGKYEYTTSVGSSIKVPLVVESGLGLPLTFDTSLLPRGAMFDEATQTISWKPTKTQVGENLVSITVSDGTFEKKLTFVVNVFGSTTAGAGSTSKDEANEGSNAGNAGNEGSGTAGGGGGGGGTELPKPEDKPTDPVTPDVPEADGFRDLGNHTWAEEAINYLADEGIIKGTSEVTFAPAANITRADFAILLVRAFKLESENTENFADVSANDYFAGELAIARNTGIVGGIGDNKYAPRKTITRQDMMVIVYRVLNKLGIELKDGEADYPDFDKLPDYAKDAVRALIANGLVNGKNGLIDGSANTTRAEVAVLVKRIIDFAAKK